MAFIVKKQFSATSFKPFFLVFSSIIAHLKRYKRSYWANEVPKTLVNKWAKWLQLKLQKEAACSTLKGLLPNCSKEGSSFI